MNLNDNPTIEQQKALFAACDDNAGHHALWVQKNGEVRLSVIPEHLSPIGFEKQTPDMQMRYETFVQGNDYVGENAANDDDFMQRVFTSLNKEWPAAKSKSESSYIDMF